MKKILLGAAAALFLTFAATNLYAAAFEDGSAAYQSGDFKKASKLYEDSLSQKKSAAAYFNLGNACFRQGQKAKAVLNFERARALAPRDKDINWNLNLAKSTLADRPEAPNDALFIFWLKKIADFFTLDELAALFFAGFVTLFIISGLAYFFLKFKGFWHFLIAVTGVYLAAAGILLAVKWAEVKDPRVLIVDKEVHARFGPSNTETKAFLLHEGAEAKISDESKSWYYIRYSNASSGWVPKSACEVI